MFLVLASICLLILVCAVLFILTQILAQLEAIRAAVERQSYLLTKADRREVSQEELS